MLKAKKQKLNFFEKAVLTLNCVAAFALLVCYLAPYVNPAHFWPVAFFGMAYIPILCTNAVCMVFWLVRLRRQAILSAVCIVLGLGLMGLNIGFRKQTFEVDKANANLIRVMTYNVFDFSANKNGVNYLSNDTILNLVKRQQPDILSMQEYLVFRDRKITMPMLIKQAMQAQYYYFKAVKITETDSTGIVMFSKYPIINRDTIPTLNGITTEGMFIDVKRGAQILRIYNFHLQSTHFSRADNAYLDSLTGNSSKASLHQSKQISSKLKLAFIKRAQQVAGLKTLLAQCPYPYIIMGDFNDTPLSYAINYLSKGVKNAFVEKGYGLGVTFYGEYPGFQLDYVMVSPQFNVINYKILRERISDHYPLISDLELR